MYEKYLKIYYKYELKSAYMQSMLFLTERKLFRVFYLFVYHL